MSAPPAWAIEKAQRAFGELEPTPATMIVAGLLAADEIANAIEQEEP